MIKIKIYSQKELIEKGKKYIENGDKRFVEAKIDNEKMSIMLFTSGTTSKSKAVALSHKNLCTNIQDIASMFDINEKIHFYHFYHYIIHLNQQLDFYIQFMQVELLHIVKV